jgi:hypothetical protein
MIAKIIGSTACSLLAIPGGVDRASAGGPGPIEKPDGVSVY